MFKPIFFSGLQSSKRVEEALRRVKGLPASPSKSPKKAPPLRPQKEKKTVTRKKAFNAAKTSGVAMATDSVQNSREETAVAGPSGTGKREVSLIAQR